MPELPEVEVVRRELIPFVCDKHIKSIDIFDPRFSLPIEKCVGKRVVTINRKGKFLFFEFFDGSSLLAHLGMTGHFSCTTSRENFPHQRILFTLSEGYLIYCDQRKFGRFRYLEPEQKNQCLCELGVDPLSREYTFDLWNALLSPRKEKIKSFLMNQKYISGIGNIYASEILFRSGIHPEKRVDVLTEQEQKDLFRVIPEVLNQAICFEGTTIRDYQHSDGTTGSFQDELLVYGKEGELCPVCGTPLERIKISSRSTYFCPVCQNIKK